MLRVGGSFARGASLIFSNWKEVSSGKDAIANDGKQGFTVHSQGSFDAVWLSHIAKRVATKVTTLTLENWVMDIIYACRGITEKYFPNIKKLVLKIPIISPYIAEDFIITRNLWLEELDIVISVENEEIECIASCVFST